MRSIPIDRHVSRPDTAASYSGVAAYGNNSYYIDGEYHDPHKQQLGSYPLRVANAKYGNATESDYGIKSKWHIQIIDLIWMKDTLVLLEALLARLFRSFRRIETNT